MALSKKKKTVIIICGPTAVGKTGIAIEVAKNFHTEIISADSRQCFRELEIGVARPSIKNLNEVKHHFIASHSIHDEMNASIFENYAIQKAEEIFSRQNVAIMVGGTGLYIKAFCEGLDNIPGSSSLIRARIADEYKKNGLGWLQDEVKKKDPSFYATGEFQNPQRMMRALEVVETTGKSILDFHKRKKTKRDFNILKIGIELPKDELHRNIETRVEQMIEVGLVEEVRKLLPDKQLNALQTVGYSEIFVFLEGKSTLTKAVDDIKKNTRQYAKRQMTWFRKDKEVQWFFPLEIDKIIEFATKKINQEIL